MKQNSKFVQYLFICNKTGLRSSSNGFNTGTVLHAWIEWQQRNIRNLDGLTQEHEVWEQLAVLILSNIYV